MTSLVLNNQANLFKSFVFKQGIFSYGIAVYFIPFKDTISIISTVGFNFQSLTAQVAGLVLELQVREELLQFFHV